MAADETVVIANEAEATRDRIAQTVDELQDRLSPKNVVNDALGSVREAIGSVGDAARGAGQEFIGSATGIARENPIVLIAGVAAIGLLALAGTKLSGARVETGSDMNGYTDYDDGYSSNYGSSYDSGEQGRLAAFGSRAQAQLEDNPIVGIIIGLAAGALLGALFPATATENRVLGQSRERLSAAARAAARTAKQQLDEHGLSVENVKAQAQRVVGEVKSAAQSVTQAAKDELKGSGASATTIDQPAYAGGAGSTFPSTNTTGVI